jgi:hypothetical protein
MRHSAFHLPKQPILKLAGTESELKVLDRLQRYDVLSSVYATAGMAEYFRRTLLTRLIKAQAIRIPSMAKDYARRRNVYYPVEITPHGETVLAVNNRWAGRERGDDHFEHKYYRSMAEFLFDYAAELAPGLRAKSLDDLLADPRCPASTREDPHPDHLPLSERQFIIPDFYRAYEYRGLATMHFHIEVDRNTEPLTTTADRKNIFDKIAHYDRYFDQGGPTDRYGITQATVLWITTEAARKDAILRLLEKSGVSAALRHHRASRFHRRFCAALGSYGLPAVGACGRRHGHPPDPQGDRSEEGKPS